MLKVLFTGCTFNNETLEKLKKEGIQVFNGKINYTEDELINVLKDYDCYINGGDEICTRKVIENNKHLKLISFMGTGYQKYIDTKAAKEFNIPVSYTPSANARSVAEYTCALILDAVKKISYSNKQVKNGIWEKYQTFDLKGKMIGIIGMGAIGNQIAKIMCDGFGMKLMYNSKNPKEEIDKKYNISMSSLNDIFKDADVISINATCTDENKGMITKEQLSLMKPSSILINTARAELINKEDLESTINNINCIAMDGYYSEPINETEKVLSTKDDRFIITPHNAYNSFDATINMEDMLIQSLKDVSTGENIRYLIDDFR